jgi:hypothetical protein
MPSSQPTALSGYGISRDQSSNWQRIASLTNEERSPNLLNHVAKILSRKWRGNPLSRNSVA